MACCASRRWLDGAAWPTNVSCNRLAEIGGRVESLIHKLTTFLIEQKLQRLGEVDLI